MNGGSRLWALGSRRRSTWPRAESRFILGISAFYHDSAACLLADGEIVAAASEERFTRRLSAIRRQLLLEWPIAMILTRVFSDLHWSGLSMDFAGTTHESYKCGRTPMHHERSGCVSGGPHCCPDSGVSRHLTRAISVIPSTLFTLLAACAPIARPTTSPSVNRSDARTEAVTHSVSGSDTLLRELTVNIVTALAKGDPHAASRDFGDRLGTALPPERLQEVWSSLVARFGAFRKAGDSRVESLSGVQRVVLAVEFERARLSMQAAFGPDDRVVGVAFVPAEQPEAPPSAPLPDYVVPQRFREAPLVVGSGRWRLPGTLTMPTAPGNVLVPAVVLVHGSGPSDRDGTVGPNRPFRDLALGLASRGIAVLRYDKRTRVHAEEVSRQLESLTVQEETVDDAVAAVDVLRSTPGIDPRRIVVVGYSLGGMLVPRIAVATPEAAGFVILAAPSRPLEDVILDQAAYLADRGYGAADPGLARVSLLEQVARVKDPALSPSTPRADLPLGLPAHYWLDLRGYDPAAAAAGIERPLLVLHGARDYQVPAADHARWRAALELRPLVSLRVFPGLNHLLMDGSGPSTPDEYQRPGHVAGVVIDAIASWSSALTPLAAVR